MVTMGECPPWFRLLSSVRARTNTNTCVTLGTLGGDNDCSIFWMAFKDFVRHFNFLFVCRIFEASKWHTYTAESKWEGQSAGGHPGLPTASNNPQVRLQGGNSGAHTTRVTSS